MKDSRDGLTPVSVTPWQQVPREPGVGGSHADSAGNGVCEEGVRTMLSERSVRA